MRLFEHYCLLGFLLFLRILLCLTDDVHFTVDEEATNSHVNGQEIVLKLDFYKESNPEIFKLDFFTSDDTTYKFDELVIYKNDDVAMLLNEFCLRNYLDLQEACVALFSFCTERIKKTENLDKVSSDNVGKQLGNFTVSTKIVDPFTA